MSARRLVLIAVVGLVAAILAYSLYWMHAAGQARNHLQSWTEARRAEGWAIGWGEATQDGFPWRLRLTLTAPELTHPSGLRWQAPHVELWTAPLWPRAVHVETAGNHTVTWAGRDWPLSLERLAATIASGSLDAHLHGLQTGQSRIADLGLSLSALPPRPDPSGHPASWRFALSGRDIQLPSDTLPGFDGQMALAEISGRVMGAIPTGTPVAAIAGWSKQGGIIELDRVALDWPPMGLEGTGTAALDPSGQPLVALSTRIHGFDALMDRLYQAGLVDQATARTSKTLLGLMAKPDPRGRPAIPAPVTIQDGGLYLGPARIGAVPGIPWASFAAP